MLVVAGELPMFVFVLMFMFMLCIGELGSLSSILENPPSSTLLLLSNSFSILMTLSSISIKSLFSCVSGENFNFPSKSATDMMEFVAE